jgi:DNA-binding PadR family transcriptional regulator
MTPPKPATITLPKLLSFAALMNLARAGEEGVYGYQLKKLLLELPLTRRNPPDISGVYRTLKRLEKKGFLTSKVGERIKGPERRIFQITPAGNIYLQEWIQALEEWHYEIHSLMEAARDTGLTDIILE